MFLGILNRQFKFKTSKFVCKLGIYIVEQQSTDPYYITHWYHLKIEYIYLNSIVNTYLSKNILNMYACIS